MPGEGKARHVEVRRGAYRDSVALMQASRTVAAAPGVSDAMIAMATELNLDLIQDLGFDRPADAGPNDLVVAVAAADRDALDRALALVESVLAGPGRAPPVAAGPVRAGAAWHRSRRARCRRPPGTTRTPNSR